MTCNPLRTKNQLYLDELATSLHQQDPFTEQQQKTRDTFLATVRSHGPDIAIPSLDLLDEAVDELAFAGVQQAVNDDPEHPRVGWVSAPPRIWRSVALHVPGGRYGDNPDCVYRTVPISGSGNYLVRGKRAGAKPTDLSFSLTDNSPARNTVAILTGNDLVLDDDGSFTISISPSASSSPNHLQGNSSVNLLFVRYNIGDWVSESVDALDILIDEHEPAATEPNKPAILAKARQYFQEITLGIAFALNVTYSNAVNTLPLPDRSGAPVGLATQVQALGHYNLKADEALVVTIKPGKADYLSLSVTSWLKTVDPRDQLISLNNKQAAVNSDGTYTIVLTAADPGVSNWLKTSEQGPGTMSLRLQGIPPGQNTKGDIDVSTHVCGVKDLPSVLPANTSSITPEQRKHQLEVRAEGYDKVHGK
ncbi:hypothetical protein K4F52_002261 [Lecanicillium sp. MT-2017a]|nr:hypothetical protein K4F52_002261 [Lecanicillium sp. MT-2017a]